MRISDWSSDVCSSDLPCAGSGLRRQVQQRHSQHHHMVAMDKGASRRISKNHFMGIGALPRKLSGVLYVIFGKPACDCTTIGRDVTDFTARSEEHTSELQSLMRISYAVFCLKKKIYQ